MHVTFYTEREKCTSIYVWKTINKRKKEQLRKFWQIKMTLRGQTDNNPFIKGVKEYDVIRRYYISRSRGALLHDLYFFLYRRGFQIAFFVSLTGHLYVINLVDAVRFTFMIIFHAMVLVKKQQIVVLERCTKRGNKILERRLSFGCTW